MRYTASIHNDGDEESAVQIRRLLADTFSKRMAAGTKETFCPLVLVTGTLKRRAEGKIIKSEPKGWSRYFSSEEDFLRNCLGEAGALPKIVLATLTRLPRVKMLNQATMQKIKTESKNFYRKELSFQWRH